MLIARLRADNPLGPVPLTCDAAGKTYILEGVGRITPAKLLDLENRQQLVWGVDHISRDRVLSAAVAQVRAETSGKAARAAAFAAAAAAAARETQGAASGIPAARTKFAATDRIAHDGRRVAWTETPVAAPPARQAKVTPRFRRLKIWNRVIFAIAVLAVVALVIRFPHPAAHQLALSFTRQATPHTELYFTDPQTLPTKLNVPGPNRFEFTVVNHEGRARAYAYVVTLTGSSGSTVIDKGTLSLGDNIGAGKVVDIVVTRQRAAYVVTVMLSGPRQAIYFRGYS